MLYRYLGCPCQQQPPSLPPASHMESNECRENFNTTRHLLFPPQFHRPSRPSRLSASTRPGPTKPLKVACDGHRKLFSPLYKNGLKKGSVRPCTWMSASPASHAELRGKNALEMFGPCTSQKVASMRMTVRPPRLGKNTSQALLHCTTWTGYAR